MKLIEFLLKLGLFLGFSILSLCEIVVLITNLAMELKKRDEVVPFNEKKFQQIE